MDSIAGIHHVTTIAADAARSIRFYTDVLGLTLISKTVNFDEIAVLHFYCGDQRGSPGSLVTFFVHDKAPQGHLGLGQVSAMVLAVSPGTFPFWRNRLAAKGVEIRGQAWAFGEEHLCFTDPDGLELALVEEAGEARAGERSFEIHRVRSVEIQIEGFIQASRFLVDQLGFKAVAQEGAAARFRTGDERSGAIDLVCAPNCRPGTPGPGIAHHIAWRVSDDASLARYSAALLDYGTDVTPPLDRHYFRAIYFRALGGIRFGLATDGPGFDDEHRPVDLDSALSLPPWLESKRRSIERRLGKLDHA